MCRCPIPATHITAVVPGCCPLGRLAITQLESLVTELVHRCLADNTQAHLPFCPVCLYKLINDHPMQASEQPSVTYKLWLDISTLSRAKTLFLSCWLQPETIGRTLFKMSCYSSITMCQYWDNSLI